MRPVLIETARYWQSRVEVDGDGRGHLRHVIGPDEYHEDIDDSIFTNEMARWNLEIAAALDGGGIATEQRDWQETARRLATSRLDASGAHEQFAGFFDLDPVLAESVGTPPVAADSLLGHDRIQQVQVIKQADVLMLHHLLPDRMAAGSLEADLDYYLPRTAHGSSLSPAITASVLARAGRSSESGRWFELAARFDLDDISGTTAGGLHLATMGGLWQALAFGVIGLRPNGNVLTVAPMVPEAWGHVTLRVTHRSIPLQIQASSSRIHLTAPQLVSVDLVGVGRVETDDLMAIRAGDQWSLQ